MKCLMCEREVAENSCGFNTERGYICMQCENSMIDVWKVSAFGVLDYYTIDKEDAKLHLTNLQDNSEDEINIDFVKIRALQYYDLPAWGDIS